LLQQLFRTRDIGPVLEHPANSTAWIAALAVRSRRRCSSRATCRTPARGS
jgi:hypothetical protein